MRTKKPAVNVVAELRERGLLSQITESGLEAAAQAGPLTLYCGFDPSAASLQIGNLVPVMVLAHWQRGGHKPIMLVGGGTGMIGDPSGRSEERNLLSHDDVMAYTEIIQQQLARYLDFSGANAARLMNNFDWLNKITLIDYLRDIGKHFTVNSMIAREAVATRMQSDDGISYTEFSYMILQATDYLHLYEHEGCTVQVGGHDQWGNLVSGVDLIRRKHGAHVHAMTVPLITTANGQKFGKSAGNALWLDPARTTPYDLFQYWINIDDRDVSHYLKVFTFMPLAEIAGLDEAQATDPGKRVAQKRLAFEVTKLVHGEEVARAVEAATRVLFGEGIAALTPDVLPHLASAVPTSDLPETFLPGTTTLVDLLVAAGIQPSKGAARRLIQQGGISVNDARWTDVEAPLGQEHLLFGKAMLIRAGKNRYHLLRGR
ncbi:MAG TPA: tyrosine--tRNA ligase [Ktedonobacterales bacterium]